MNQEQQRVHLYSLTSTFDVAGWHRIHLFSTTLHRLGIGIYVDAGGWIWFSEDMVS